MTALLWVMLGGGLGSGARYLVGLFIGTNLVCLGVITGLAAVLLAEPGLRIVLTVISAGYLLWLAFRIAFAGAKLAFIDRPAPPGIRGGIILQVFNPKAYVVNTTLFSGFAFWAAHPALEMTVKLVILNALWITIHIIWLWLGVTLRRMNLGEGLQRAINIVMAVAMMAVVALAARGAF